MKRECVYDVFMSREVHLELAPYLEKEPDELSKKSIAYIEATINEHLAKLEQKQLYRAVLTQCGDDIISALSKLYEIHNSSWVMSGYFDGLAHCSETNTFFDSHQNDIRQLVFEFDDIRGESYMANRIGEDFLVSGEQVAKNTAAWFAFEYIAEEIMKIELDPDKIEFISKEKQE